MVDQPEPPASELKRLALAKFPSLSETETLLLEKVPTGEEAKCPDTDYDPSNADAWGPTRRIRATLMAWLCTDERAQKLVHYQGIQVYGAEITGPLDLSFANVPFPLAFRHCRLNESVDLSRAEVSELDLTGSLVHGIRADGLVVKNNVYLCDGFTSQGEVRLLHAQIGINLECDAGSFINKGGRALNVAAISVKGQVYLRSTTKSHNKEGLFTAHGEVNLDFAQIDGQLDCTGGVFNNAGGTALSVNRIIVKSKVFLTDGFIATGEVKLSGAQIGGAFNCAGGNFHAATLDLTDATASTVVDSGLNNIPADKPSTCSETIWPQSGGLLLDGFNYVRISSDGRFNVKKRLRWLGLQPQSPFHPKPYLQLAKVLQESGDSEGALCVKERMEDLRRKEERSAKSGFWSFLLNWAATFWNFLLKWTIGYGYYPKRAIWWLVLLAALGWFIYGRSYFAGTMTPTDKDAYNTFEAGGPLPPHYPKFSASIYSLENSLPLAKLGQADKWQPAPQPQQPAQNRSSSEVWSKFATSPCFLIWFLRGQILLGWLLATFFVAGVSGIVHKE
jgi:hypothetical protein